MANYNRYGSAGVKMQLITLLIKLVILAVIVFFGWKGYTIVKNKMDEAKAQKEYEAAHAEEFEAARREAVATVNGEAALPVSYWQFEDTMNNIYGTSDEAVYGETVLEDVTDEKIGVRGALHFDGSGDYIDCGRGYNITGPCSFAFLFNCENVDKGYSALFAKYETNAEGPYAFSINHGAFNCWISESSYSYVELESITEIENDKWYCVVVTFQDGKAELFVNGEYDSSVEYESIINNSDMVTIGRQAYVFSSDLEYEGYIGEIRYYDYVLSEDQIHALSDVLLYEDGEPGGFAGMFS